MNEIIKGNALDILKTMPPVSIDCCITSPPYWGLRDYGMDGQLGMEPRAELYIEHLIQVFDEVKRVLKPTGTCFAVISDSYGGNLGKNAGYRDPKAIIESPRFQKSCISGKSLVGIPEHFALAMGENGWIRRNTIIWHKPNCMPSSVDDRFTVDFEYVYFFTKNKRYYFNQQLEPYSQVYLMDKRHNSKELSHIPRKDYLGQGKAVQTPTQLHDNMFTKAIGKGRNKRCVWTIPTSPFPEAHFAIFPEDLIAPMIDSGCPEGGIVLDPFMGAGTTAVVARKKGRNFIGIELNPEYCKIAERRLEREVGSLLEAQNSCECETGD